MPLESYLNQLGYSPNAQLFACIRMSAVRSFRPVRSVLPYSVSRAKATMWLYLNMVVVLSLLGHSWAPSPTTCYEIRVKLQQCKLIVCSFLVSPRKPHESRVRKLSSHFPPLTFHLSPLTSSSLWIFTSYPPIQKAPLIPPHLRPRLT